MSFSATFVAQSSPPKKPEFSSFSSSYTSATEERQDLSIHRHRTRRLLLALPVSTALLCLLPTTVSSAGAFGPVSDSDKEASAILSRRITEAVLLLDLGRDSQRQGDFVSALEYFSQISVCATENPVDASLFESFEASHSSHDLSNSISKKLGIQAPPVRMDSQAKYGALTKGDGAIFMRFPSKGYREKIWDHAAGSIVVTEAGGMVVDAAGKPLDCSKGSCLDRDTGIIATNLKLMPLVLKAVQDEIGVKS